MARREAFATVIDIADKMPDKVGQDGYLYKWDNEQNKYINSGLRMTAIDDPSAVKFFKLGLGGDVPTAPKGKNGASDGFASITELKDYVLGSGELDWHDDPRSVSKEYPVQWCAVYGYKNIARQQVGDTEVIFEERYTLTSVILYSTFGTYYTVDGNSITIHNPDGSTAPIAIATPKQIEELQRGLDGIKKQVDGLKESFSGEGEPTMDSTKYPMSEWFSHFETQPTDPVVITNVYQAHIEDTYFDLNSNLSYRFVQKPSTDSSHLSSYEWKVVTDTALAKAIADLHAVAGESVKIFATQPVPPYKKGDIWIYEGAKFRTCVKPKAQGEAFELTDWLDPYATVEQVNQIQQDLTAVKTDLKTAQGNITDLTGAMTDFSGSLGDVFKGNIDIQSFVQSLPALHEQLDKEQAELTASLNRVLASPFLDDTTLVNNLTGSKNEVLGSGGKLDQIQSKVDVAVADGTLTFEEMQSIKSLHESYTTAYKLLKERFEACQTYIANKQKERVDNIKVGGRNLLIGTDFRRIDRLDTRWWRSEFQISHDVAYPYVAYGYGWQFIYKSVHLEPGTYTLSVTAKSHEQGKPGELRVDTTFLRYGRTFGTTTDEWRRYSIQIVVESPYDGHIILLDSGRNKNTIRFADIKLERGTVATDWTPAPEDVQAEIDAINANPPRVNPTTKNWEVYKFINGVGKYVDTGDSSIGDDGKTPEIREGYWWVYNSDIGDWQNSGIKAQGEDGEDALSHTIQVQGELGVRGIAVKDGKLLVTPEIIKEVRGGVNGYVECKLLVYKGGKEVTADAISKGADPLWYRVSGGTKVLVQTGGDVFNIDKSWADGVNDFISCTIEDERMSEWGK